MPLQAGASMRESEVRATHCHSVLQVPAIQAERDFCMRVWNDVEEYTSPLIASIYVGWLLQAVQLSEDDKRSAQACMEAKFVTDPTAAKLARQIKRDRNGAFKRLGFTKNRLPPVGYRPMSHMSCMITSPMQVLCCSAACHV